MSKWKAVKSRLLCSNLKEVYFSLMAFFILGFPFKHFHYFYDSTLIFTSLYPAYFCEAHIRQEAFKNVFQ